MQVLSRILDKISQVFLCFVSSCFAKSHNSDRMYYIQMLLSVELPLSGHNDVSAMVYYSLPCRVTAFTNARSMITMFYESGTSVREVWSGDGLSRDVRTRCCAPDVVRTSQQQNHILFLVCRSFSFYSLFQSFTPSFSLSLPPARSFTLFRPDLSQTRLPQITGSPDHQTIRPDRTGLHRAASRRTAPHRTINSALSRYCELLKAPCYSVYCLLSATPSSATRVTPLLSTACGTIKSQLSHQRISKSHPCVREE